MRLKYDKEAIREDVPIRDVIEMYTGQTIKNDRQVKCPDPNHPDRNPSANILKKSNICYCHACAHAFDVFDVVMKNTGKTFPEACEELLNAFNLPLEQYSNIEEIRALEEARGKGEYVAPFPVSFNDLKFLGLPTGNTVPNPDYDVETIVVKDNYGEIVEDTGWRPMYGDKFKYGIPWVDANGVIVRDFEEDEKKRILPPLPLDHYEVIKQGELYHIEPEIRIVGLHEQWKDKSQRGHVEDILLQACDRMETYLTDYQQYIFDQLYNEYGGEEGYQKAVGLSEAYDKLTAQGKRVTLSPEQEKTIHDLKVLQHAAKTDLCALSEEMNDLSNLRQQILELREKRLEHEGPSFEDKPVKKEHKQPVRAWAER